VTNRFARAYAKASKKDKGRVLDQVAEVTGWSRDNARRRLVAAATSPPGAGRKVAVRPRKPRSPKYSYDAVKILQRVWAASGGQCGKNLGLLANRLTSSRGRMSVMPKKYPPEFKRDVVTVARRGDLSVVEVATDFGVAEETVRRWMKQADVDDGIKDGLTTAEQAEIVQLRRDKRRLEMENEILRRAAAYFAASSLPK